MINVDEKQQEQPAAATAAILGLCALRVFRFFVFASHGHGFREMMGRVRE
jgi:hypothetical protein